MAEFRSANYHEADQWLTTAYADVNPWTRRAAQMFRAMTRYHLGQVDDARADFEAARALMNPNPDRTELTFDLLDLNNIVFWLAYEEAQDLLEGEQTGTGVARSP